MKDIKEGDFNLMMLPYYLFYSNMVMRENKEKYGIKEIRINVFEKDTLKPSSFQTIQGRFLLTFENGKMLVLDFQNFHDHYDFYPYWDYELKTRLENKVRKEVLGHIRKMCRT